MKKLNITKNKILVEGKPYTVLEIDKSTIIIRGKTKDVTNQHDITNDEGVYLFIVNKDIPNFSKEKFASEVTGIFFNDGKPYAQEMEVPPFIAMPQKDCLLYVGTDKEVVSRIRQHWTTMKFNGCTSLKLGFKSRQWIKDYLKVFVILKESNPGLDRKSLEKAIRLQYGVAYGK